MKLSDLIKKKPTVSLTKNPELDRKLSLRKESVSKAVLNKKIGIDTARVVFVLDHSGSMRKMYKDGTVQDVLERIFPLAMFFDDNSEMEFYLFDSVFIELRSVNVQNLDGYVENIILSRNDHFGGTCYAPIMEEIIERYTRREPSNTPTFVIFITDGSNSDKTAAKKALTAASDYNIFWKFVGIGKEKFEFLEKLDTMEGRKVDNANFVQVNSISEMSDAALYNALLDEYGDWQYAARNAGIPVI